MPVAIGALAVGSLVLVSLSNAWAWISRASSDASGTWPDDINDCAMST
jgi:hypothetical protein